MVIRRFRPSGRDTSLQQFEQYLAPHLSQLYQLAYRFCNNQHDAEDLVQDVVIKLLPRRDELSGIEQLRPWLAKVLYRQFIDNYRHKSRSPLTQLNESDNSLENQLAPRTDNPEFQTELNMEQRRILVALSSLNEDQRSVVILHDIEGYTLKELESILDSPIGTLKSRLNRARTQLREKLQEK